jgi:hypothetical protein
MGNDKMAQGGEDKMKDRLPRRYEEDVIDLGIYFAILRKVWWKIALLSISTGFRSRRLPCSSVA